MANLLPCTFSKHLWWSANPTRILLHTNTCFVSSLSCTKFFKAPCPTPSLPHMQEVVPALLHGLCWYNKKQHSLQEWSFFSYPSSLEKIPSWLLLVATLCKGGEDFTTWSRVKKRKWKRQIQKKRGGRCKKYVMKGSIIFKKN